MSAASRKPVTAAADKGNESVAKRLAFRGGGYNNTSNAGLFALNLNYVRTNRNRNVGFRPALIPYVRNPVATAAGTVRG